MMSSNRKQIPLVSIVIANYNYGRFLVEAIESILQQSCQDFEIIIVDGGSTDESVNVIKKYAGGLPAGSERENKLKYKVGVEEWQVDTKISYWISEPDKGQSDAFNKGFAHARGRFWTWLNADDVLLPGTIDRLRAAAERDPSCRWFAGGCLWLDPEMCILRCVRARRFSDLRFRCGMVSVWGPSSFFTSEVFNEVGGVDERFHYTMDSDLWLKFARRGYRYKSLPGYAYGLRMHPEAKMSGHNFATSSQKDPNHPKWTQLKNERIWMHEGYNELPFTSWRRLLTMGWHDFIRSCIDQIKMKGLYYAGIGDLG